MSDLAIYDFKEQPVRILDKDGEPWFVAADVCRILGIGNPTQAVSRLQDDERNTLTTNEGIRGNPTVNAVSESGLYALIFTSRKPAAQDFRKWVTHEVLPAIRKNGKFELNGNEKLPEVAPEPNVCWETVISFVERVPKVRAWSLRQIIYFGLTVQRAAKAFGIEWRTKPDSRFGNIRAVPSGLLAFVAREMIEHPENAIELQSRDQNDLCYLIEAAGDTLEPGEKRELSFDQLIDIAKPLGLFKEAGLKEETPIDQRIRSLVGKHLSRANKRKFGDLTFEVIGTGRCRKFVVRKDDLVL